MLSDHLIWVISISPPGQVRNVRDNTFQNMTLNESFMHLNGPEWIIQATEWSWMNHSSTWMVLNESFKQLNAPEWFFDGWQFALFVARTERVHTSDSTTSYFLSKSRIFVEKPEWIIQATEWSWMNHSTIWMVLNESFKQLNASERIIQSPASTS